MEYKSIKHLNLGINKQESQGLGNTEEHLPWTKAQIKQLKLGQEFLRRSKSTKIIVKMINMWNKLLSASLLRTFPKLIRKKSPWKNLKQFWIQQIAKIESTLIIDNNIFLFVSMLMIKITILIKVFIITTWMLNQHSLFHLQCTHCRKYLYWAYEMSNNQAKINFYSLCYFDQNLVGETILL